MLLPLSKDHVFRFNLQELCPLIEEYTVIFGCSLDSTVVIALYELDMQFPNRLCAFFDLPLSEIYSYTYNHKTISLSALITAYEAKENNNNAWSRIVSFFHHTQFLLVSSHGDAGTRIVNIL